MKRLPFILIPLLALLLVALFWKRAPESVESSGPGVVPVTDPHAGFVDQANCVRCHEKEAKEWAHSDHALGMQRATEETVLGDFSDVTFVHYGVTSRMYRAEGAFRVETENASGVMEDYEVSYTIGIRPLQQYLVEMTNGHIQTLQVCWDTEKKEWFHLYDEPIPAGDPLHWTGMQFKWNFMCADCHTTSLAKNYDLKNNRYQTSWSHINVSCQACHGPGEAHVSWAESRKGDEPYEGDDLQVRFSETNAVAEIESCARCHARRSQLQAPHPHGSRYFDSYTLQLLSDTLYFADGQIQDEVYVYGSFMQSKMHERGVRCTDCHNPHTAELRVEGNALCVQCHSPAGNSRFGTLAKKNYDSPEHHFHTVGTPGAQCVNCHMDSKVYMGVDPRRDHSFRIPRPDLTKKIGTPNACASCHSDKKADWVYDAFIARYPKYGGTGVYHFAETFARGREGNPSAMPELIGLVGDTNYPAIVRATALELLTQFPHNDSLSQMVKSLNDPSPLVRQTAVIGVDVLHDPAGNPFAQRQQLTWLAPLLDDEMRLVRSEVGRVLGRLPDALIEGSLKAGMSQAKSEFFERQTITDDRPESHMNLGFYHQSTGDPVAAEKAYLTAIRLDPGFQPARFNIATLYNTLGRNAEALTHLREVVTRYPRNGQGWYSLGLLYGEMNDSENLLTALKNASELLPGNGRVHYNYALSLQRAGKPEAAHVVYQKALALEPQNLDFLYATAINLMQQRKGRQASEYVQAMLVINPQDERAIGLMRALQSPRQGQ